MQVGPEYPLVVVVPIFEDVEASSRLFKELASAFGEDIFIVAVDDGSIYEPVDVAALQAARLHGVLVRLKRNEGHQRAIAVGLSWVADELGARAGVIVTMDSDGEDIPQSIKILLRALENQDVDVVVAQRKSRVESLQFRAFYVLYRKLFRLLTGHEISFGNFMAMKARAMCRLASMSELWIHLAGALLASQLRVVKCPIDRGARYAGNSKLNFVGLALHGFRGVMVFAENVLVRVGIACAIVAALSVLCMAIAVLLKIVGMATPGWFSVALGILLLVFLQTGTLSLMTLMLTGVVKGGAVHAQRYKEMVLEVIPTDDGVRG